MSIKSKLQDSIKQAMRNKESQRLATLRLVSAAIKQREVDSGSELNDDELIELFDRLIKQRNESIKQFSKGGRDDLVVKEEQEISVIREFLPEPLTPDSINEIIKNAITESGAESMRDMGKVMAIIKPQVQGKADIASVSAMVKNSLA